MDLKRLLEEEVLPFVQRPARYIGGEINASARPSAEVRLLLSYPDVYEVGMSHLGLQILYDIVNRDQRFSAERAFAVWTDMEQRMKEKSIPLFSLESFRPARDFHVWGFSLQSELTYTNILGMLDLAGLPLRAADRPFPRSPIVLGGGMGAYNPEPLADFFDLFFVGDGEEGIIEILASYREFMQGRQKKAKDAFTKIGLLKYLVTKVPGLYAPALFRPEWTTSGRFVGLSPLDPAIPPQVNKRVLQDLNRSSVRRPLVPLTEVIHDRSVVEIMRGCPRGCRFCAAGWTGRPIRTKKKEEVIREALSLLEATGRGEVSLLSLSSGDHPQIVALMEELSPLLASRRVSLSLPSLSIASVVDALLTESKRVRKSGVTLAPEAASRFLQRVINKECDPDRLWEISQKLKAWGWRLIKLYFMIGLPGEMGKDVEEIAHLINRMSRWGGKLNVTVSTFVPKPLTPLQWSPLASPSEIREKQALIRGLVRSRGVKLKCRKPEMSFIEGVIARGDRKTAALLAAARQEGCRFDDWEECFDYGRWEKAFRRSALLPEEYARAREIAEPLPWEHIQAGVSKEVLVREAEQAGREEP